MADSLHSVFPVECLMWFGGTMPAMHRHDTIEINVPVKKPYSIFHGGRSKEIGVGKSAVFWAAYPHRALKADRDHGVLVVHLPLVMFLGWGLPEDFIHHVLSGELVVSAMPRESAFAWVEEADAAKQDRVLAAAILAEMNAFLLRSALSSRKAGRLREDSSEATPGKLQQMATYLSSHCTEGIKVTDVARHVSLNPTYASAIFSRYFGVSIKAYLTGQRLAMAQQMLIVTNRSIIEIAYACGFQTLSRFYAAFKNRCGVPPLTYRNQMQGDFAENREEL